MRGDELEAVTPVAAQHLMAFRCRFVQLWDCFFRGFSTDLSTDFPKAEAQAYTVAEQEVQIRSFAVRNWKAEIPGRK